MRRRLFSALLAALPVITQAAPVIAQTTATATTTDPNTEVSLPGLYYDPDPGPSPTFEQLDGAEAAGYVEVPPEADLTYRVDRAWPEGATPDQILKFGDLEQNPATASFTKLTLREISAKQGVDIAGVPVGDVPLVGNLTVGQVDELYSKIGNGEQITVAEAAPAVQAAIGILEDPSQAGRQLQNAALSTGEKVLVQKLSSIPALKGIPLQDLAQGNWEGVISKAEQIELGGIGEKVGPVLQKLPVNQIVPIVDGVISGDWESVQKRAQDYVLSKGTDIALQELYKAVPELQGLPLGAIADLQNQPIEQVLPKVVDLAIEEIPESDDQTVNSVPGLSQIPVNDLPFDLAISFLAGDVFAKFDIAYSGVEGKEEPSVNHPLSGGSEDQKFRPTKCTIGSKGKQRADNCPHFEMAKTIGSLLEVVTNIENDVEGKQWAAGDSGGKGGQGVKGGKNLLKVVNFGWEPAGIHPFGTNSHTKFVLKDIKEYANKPSTARLHLAFQYCQYILFTEHCTPHFLVIPTPYKVTEGGWFLVASKRSLPAWIRALRGRSQAAAGVYCPPDQLLATVGQSDTTGSAPPADAKYGHLPYEETDEELFEVAAVDGATVGLTKDAAGAFEQMSADAAAQGLDIKAVSGFRSVADQQSIWDNKVASTSPEVVAQTSAPAGHSEHHTGLAVDVGNNQNASLEESWVDTPEYAWMQANAGKYGYELSFPAGNSQGVSFEPWHWRFVGTDSAKQVFNGQGSIAKSETIGSSAWGNSTDIHNLILTSVLESTDTQNQVDVAVSIMNRVVSSNHPDNITDVVYSPGQYEPNFGQRPAQSKEEAIERIARKTGNVQSAIAEYETLEAALNSPQSVAASQAFLNGATDFRGQSLLGNMRSGDLYRGDSGSNFFLGESQNPQVAAATLGALGVESSTVDPGSIGNSGSCDPTLLASGGNFVQGSGVASGQLSDPLGDQQYQVTSNYGWRTHPTLGGTRFHHGIDLAWDTGTPIKAADGGVVVSSGPNGAYGNYIQIDHGNGLSTWYAHNSVNYVKVGDNVDKGQPIGEIGSTGRSNGPHLDFGVIEGYQKGNVDSGTTVDPRKYINFPAKGSLNR